MSTDLFRTLADITRPLSAPKPVTEPTLARRKAREIIDQNPGATLVEIVALAYLEGRIEGVNEVRKIAHDVFDNSATCQRCGRKVRLASTAPASMADRYVCFDCSAGDEPRAA